MAFVDWSGQRRAVRFARGRVDDARRPGRPRDFEITVRGLQLNAGAGFIVVLTGDILRMPGLPERPQAEAIDLVGEEITGLR